MKIYLTGNAKEKIKTLREVIIFLALGFIFIVISFLTGFTINFYILDLKFIGVISILIFVLIGCLFYLGIWIGIKTILFLKDNIIIEK